LVQSFTPGTAITAGTTPILAEARPQVQKCTAFSPELVLPSGDVTFRLEQWSAEVGMKPGAQKLPAGKRWE
jgi:hypothetical protein